MVIKGVIRTAIAGVAFVALASQIVGAQPHPRRFEARKGDVVIDVTLSEQKVSMRSAPSRNWRSDTAPVIVRIMRGTSPPVTMWATPAFGLIDLPGRHVNVTYLTRYRAEGDRSDAEPMFGGVPIKPDARRREGETPVDLSLLSIARLEVVLTVKNGLATTSLRNTKEPVKSIIFTKT